MSSRSAVVVLLVIAACSRNDSESESPKPEQAPAVTGQEDASSAKSDSSSSSETIISSDSDLQDHPSVLIERISKGDSKVRVKQILKAALDQEEVAWGGSGRHSVFFFYGENSQVRVDFNLGGTVMRPPICMYTPCWVRDDRGKLLTHIFP